MGFSRLLNFRQTSGTAFLLKVTFFFGVLSDLFWGVLSDLHLNHQKVTWKKLVDEFFLVGFQFFSGTLKT